jgi:uncharacterized protein YegP (UPF0339 family)
MKYEIKQTEAGAYKVTFADNKQVVIIKGAKHGIDAKNIAVEQTGRNPRKYHSASTEPCNEDI